MSHAGWTISKDRESGLFFVYRPDGTKCGQTQTETGARIIRRNAIQREATPVEVDRLEDREI